MNPAPPVTTVLGILLLPPLMARGEKELGTYDIRAGWSNKYARKQVRVNGIAGEP
jgi:hypothetical protein